VAPWRVKSFFGEVTFSQDLERISPLELPTDGSTHTPLCLSYTTPLRLLRFTARSHQCAERAEGDGLRVWGPWDVLASCARPRQEMPNFRGSFRRFPPCHRRWSLTLGWGLASWELELLW
jgi:hypothetical protein